jgi:lipopolysaccharide/colanic/teichoic acid biosynthesis glycosyltransferase
MKRFFDVTFAAVGLVVLLPLFVIVAILIKLTSPGPVFFRQARVGRNLKPFRIYKFRTMTADSPNLGPSITAQSDSRVTRVGKFLRKTKIDELPQIINVLVGEMSFVGPRPEVEEYVRRYPDMFEKILVNRPGITDLASIEFRNESELLRDASNIEEQYVREILPVKLRYNLEYLEKQSLKYDILLILRTLGVVMRGH